MRRLLNETLDWEGLSEQVRKEQRNREKFHPTISTYRWWARRSHSLIGALLDRAIGLLGEGIVVSDPMAGGGTVAVEAARRGLTTFAQDINPWASFGLETTLNCVDPEALEEAASTVLRVARSNTRDLYYDRGPSGQVADIVLHVRKTSCQCCGRKNYLFPNSIVALSKRITGNPTDAWIGCPACGNAQVARWPRSYRKPSCESCGFEHPAQNLDSVRIVDFRYKCAHCSRGSSIEDPDQLEDWLPILAGNHTTEGMGFWAAPNLLRPRRETQFDEMLAKPIPPGCETNALLKYGYKYWSDVFTKRQLVALQSTVDAVKAVKCDDAVRARLLLAIAGFAEMGGHACRWDPKYRKAYGIGSNHHLCRITLAAEINPLAARGPGTMERRFASAVKAARSLRTGSTVTVTCGSSVQQPIASKSVDLVLTDPPYYDSVQYAELSLIFRVFAHAVGLPMEGQPEAAEAVPNRFLNCSHSGYIARLSSIFKETARTLKPGGRMILTFHHPRFRAWDAIGQALGAGGWKVIAATAVHSENEMDFAKIGKESICSDAILECVLAKHNVDSLFEARGPTSSNLHKNLISVSAAVAGIADGTAESLEFEYRKWLAKIEGTALLRA